MQYNAVMPSSSNHEFTLPKLLFLIIPLTKRINQTFIYSYFILYLTMYIINLKVKFDSLNGSKCILPYLISYTIVLKDTIKFKKVICYNQMFNSTLKTMLIKDYLVFD